MSPTPIRPCLAVTPVKGDWESVAIANNPKFLAIVERSRASLDAGKGVSLDEMRRRLERRRAK
jgi:hypothetical protein